MSYIYDFLGGQKVDLPDISNSELEKFQLAGLHSGDYYLNYQNYSVLHNPFRKFPYFTACNIHGDRFLKIGRKELFDGNGDRWKKDKRIPYNKQLGQELYGAKRSDFDKGHLTKREDVQWGSDRDEAISAAESTFYFTNAMPQVDSLNRGIWQQIENYILHHQTVDNQIKINLFTGPVFQEDDPDFVTLVRDEVIQLPYLFWKVIYYMQQGELHRTAFLTSQKEVLEKRRIVKPSVRATLEEDTDLFMTFKDAETYQVRVDFIEQISGLTFQDAKENFVEDTPEKIIIRGVEVRSEQVIDIEKAEINIIL